MSLGHAEDRVGGDPVSKSVQVCCMRFLKKKCRKTERRRKKLGKEMHCTTQRFEGVPTWGEKNIVICQVGYHMSWTRQKRQEVGLAS